MLLSAPVMTGTTIIRFALCGVSAALALALTNGVAHAQTTTPGTARTTTLAPLSVVNTSDLDFGRLIAGPTAGTASINPITGVRTTSGGVIAAGGTPQPATFLATGVINRAYILALGTPTLLTNGTGGTMVLAPLSLDGPNIRLFGTGGVATIRVGGQLNVGANQQPGNYSGTFTLTVIYL